MSFMVILDVYRSFIPSKITFTKYCLTQWISKPPRGFEIHWVRQYLVSFIGLVGRVSATLYKTKPIFNTSQSWKIVLIFTLHMQYKSYWTVFHLNLTVYDWFQQINLFHHMPAYNGKLLFGGHTILSDKCQLPVLSVSVACIGCLHKNIIYWYIWRNSKHSTCIPLPCVINDLELHKFILKWLYFYLRKI